MISRISIKGEDNIYVAERRVFPTEIGGRWGNW